MNLRLSRKMGNMIINISLLIISLILFFTGIIKVINLFVNDFGFGNFTTLLTPLHDWSGILLTIVSSIHLIMHRKWFVAMSKQIFHSKKFSKKEWNYLIDLGMLISLILVSITGIIKLPLLAANQELIYEYSIFLMTLHDWSGFLLIALSLTHIILHRKWLSKKLKIAFEIRAVQLTSVISLLIIIFALISVPILNSAPLPADDGYNSQTTITFESLGKLNFNPNDIETVRPDLFKENHFSVYDILHHLNQTDELALKAHFEASMNTYLIDEINGISHWWYEAYYQGGWWEDNVFRMDHYPYKEGMTIRFFTRDPSVLERIYNTWREEIQRLKQNDGEIIIPRVRISSPTNDLDFYNVSVSPHNLRTDFLQRNVLTAIDIILSLADRRLISYDLTWYDKIGNAEINSYYIEKINEDEAYGGCGFVYETGDEDFPFFQGNHIHIPSDLRIINSPEYSRWLWICL